MAYDNVIILGAGASFDAGIPLLHNFVDVMWGYAIRGRSPYGPLTAEDKQLLNEANRIRTDLERYNTRANFNTRNLEDLLSLLSFEAMAGGEAEQRFETWVKAITRTIELSTHHQDIEIPDPRNKTSVYHSLWHALLGSVLHETPPALITFNYDLVLERTLSDYFHYISNTDFKPAKPSCKISYFLEPYDFVLRSRQRQFQVPGGTPGRTISFPGFGPNFELNRDEPADVEIPYLKLHGSLNWDTNAIALEKKPKNLCPSNGPTTVAQNPLILPPVFNKMKTDRVNGIWQTALGILREAKHIILVGYSLPQTDIYMQYFLKSAVGPNSELQQIIVFDPALFRADATTEQMEIRYRDCFSPQFKERIDFRPAKTGGVVPADKKLGLGTFFHFVQTIKSESNRLLFLR